MQPTVDVGLARLADDRLARGLTLVARVVVAFLWIQNVSWKVPPEFAALRGFTQAAVDHPVFPPYTWLVENVILPHMSVFGWFVIIAESCIGAFLLVGLLTRLWGLIGAAQSFIIFLSVGMAPHEWPWSYYLMMVGCLMLAAVGAGRVWGLDAVLRPIWARSPRRLVRLLLRAS